MPQTNLYFFNSISVGVLIFWLVGYFLFFRFMVGRLMLLWVGRDFIYNQTLTRLNPNRYQLSFICPIFFLTDVVYVESFLFGVEFILLLWLVVKFFGQSISTSLSTDQSSSNINFKLVQPSTNLINDQQLIVTNQIKNLLVLFNLSRAKLFYQPEKINLLSEQVLIQLFQPYSNQWLVPWVESFFPRFELLAQNELLTVSEDDQLELE